MTSQILKYMDFTETQKPRCFENETLFFLQIKKFITHQGLLYGKNSFVAEVAFNTEIKTMCQISDKLQWQEDS